MRKLSLTKDVLTELSAREMSGVVAGNAVDDLEALARDCYTEFVCVDRITELLENKG